MQWHDGWPTWLGHTEQCLRGCACRIDRHQQGNHFNKDTPAHSRKSFEGMGGKQACLRMAATIESIQQSTSQPSLEDSGPSVSTSATLARPPCLNSRALVRHSRRARIRLSLGLGGGGCAGRGKMAYLVGRWVHTVVQTAMKGTATARSTATARCKAGNDQWQKGQASPQHGSATAGSCGKSSARSRDASAARHCIAIAGTLTRAENGRGPVIVNGALLKM